MDVKSNKEVVLQTLKDRVDSLQQRIAEIQALQQHQDASLKLQPSFTPQEQAKAQAAGIELKINEIDRSRKKNPNGSFKKKRCPHCDKMLDPRGYKKHVRAAHADLMQSDTELTHYCNLHKLYRRVLEAEELGLGYQPPVVVIKDPISDGTILKAEPSSVADAVRRIMAEHPSELMHGLEVAKAVRQRYSDIANKTSDFEAAVGYALQAGEEEGIWARVQSRVYKYK